MSDQTAISPTCSCCQKSIDTTCESYCIMEEQTFCMECFPTNYALGSQQNSVPKFDKKPLSDICYYCGAQMQIVKSNKLASYKMCPIVEYSYVCKCGAKSNTWEEYQRDDNNF